MATGSTSPTGGAANTSTLSEWAGPYVTGMLGKTQALAESPYQTYQGPLTAGPGQIQQNLFGGIGGLTLPSTLGQSFTNAGAPTAGADGQPTGGSGMAAQYMNPYLQNVLNPQLDEMRRQAQITQVGNAGKLTQAGAFGGGRQAIMDAETQRNMAMEQNKAIGAGYANAFDTGRQQFNTEQGQAQGVASLMSNIGQQQQGLEQQGVTADYNEFLQQRDNPMKQLQFQQSMLQGLPISTVANVPQGLTTGQQYAAAGTDTYALLQKLGVIPK
jgi:hypothetical protein